jgi:hypothetical protein
VEGPIFRPFFVPKLFGNSCWRFVASRPKTPPTNFDRRLAVDVKEVRKLDAYLKRVFGNPKIRVVPRPKKDDSAEVYIGEEFIGVLFVDDEDDDRSFQFQMAILEDDLVDQD